MDAVNHPDRPGQEDPSLFRAWRAQDFHHEGCLEEGGRIHSTIVDLNEQRAVAWSSDDLALYRPAFMNLFYSTYVQGSIKEAGINCASVNIPAKIKGVSAGEERGW